MREEHTECPFLHISTHPLSEENGGEMVRCFPLLSLSQPNESYSRGQMSLPRALHSM